MTERDYCFFLLPAAPLRAELATIIDRLAAQYDAASFVPHMTVYVGRSNQAEVEKQAAIIARDFAPFSMAFGSLAYTKQFFKTFFVQFDENETAHQITETIRAGCVAPSAYALDPHLSLLYQNIAETEQQNLCSTTQTPNNNYLFDTIRVVTAHTAENSDAVRKWQTVFELPLQKPFKA